MDTKSSQPTFGKKAKPENVPACQRIIFFFKSMLLFNTEGVGQTEDKGQERSKSKAWRANKQTFKLRKKRTFKEKHEGVDDRKEQLEDSGTFLKSCQSISTLELKK